MANLNTQLVLSANGKEFEFQNSSTYNEILNIEQSVSETDDFVRLLQVDPLSGGSTTGTIENPQFICIYNSSNQPAEIQHIVQGITAGASDTTGATDGNIQMLLRPLEYYIIPHAMLVNYSSTKSAMNGTTVAVDNATPDSNMFGGVTAFVDGSGLASDASATSFDIDDNAGSPSGTAGLFKVGDLIRIEDEIMEITAITDSGGTEDTLTVKRGLFGSTAATHADNTQIRLPFFNNFDDFNTYSTASTDVSGNYKSTNFFAKYRTVASNTLDGLCRGTVAIKFFEAGFQEFGLSGITSATKTGLTASTQYFVKIGIDGATADEISITTDSSVDTFGGANGFVAKLQTAIDALFSDASKNNFQKGATVSIVNGDIRVTSKQHLSTSAIALTAGTSGSDTTTEIFAQAIGRLPAAPEGAVAAKLPDDNIVKDGISVPNSEAYLMDDGFGNLIGGSLTQGSGTIDYDTGALTLTGCPSRADFVFSANGNSGLACGGNTQLNTLTSIRARSTSNKRKAKIQIIAFNK